SFSFLCLFGSHDGKRQKTLSLMATELMQFRSRLNPFWRFPLSPSFLASVAWP
ncbi:hypothetical protein AALP_AAs63801U000100, partial [Arabis alpina]